MATTEDSALAMASASTDSSDATTSAGAGTDAGDAGACGPSGTQASQDKTTSAVMIASSGFRSRTGWPGRVGPGRVGRPGPGPTPASLHHFRFPRREQPEIDPTVAPSHRSMRRAAEGRAAGRSLPGFSAVVVIRRQELTV